jgi:hypothetical protein
MKNLNQLFCFVLIMVLLSNCSLQQPGYLTLTPNSPAFTEKGETRVMAAFGANHSEFQFALAPINHIALIANTYVSEGPKSYEVGAGYFTTFSDRLIFDTHLLYTKADLNDYDVIREVKNLQVNQFEGMIEGSYDGWALQSSLTIGDWHNKYRRTPLFTFGIKGHQVHYDFLRYTTEKHYGNGSDMESYWEMDDNKRDEMFLTIYGGYRVGGDALSFMCQLAYHTGWKYYDSGSLRQPLYAPLWLTMGLEFTPTQWFKSINKINNAGYTNKF